MKRLWLISKYALTPETGNQEQRLYNMATIMKNEAEVTVITSNSNHLGNVLPRGFKIFKEITHPNEGFKIIYINAPRYLYSTSRKRALSWFVFEFNLFLYIVFFSRKKPDIAFISSLSLLTIFNGILLKALYKTKFILDIRDIWPLTLVEINGFKKYHPFIIFLHLVEYIGYKAADRITSTLEFFYSYSSTVHKKFFWLPQIYTPVQYKSGEFDFQTIRRDYKAIVCYCGSIGYFNHIELLSDIMNHAKHKSIFFLILGDGPHFAKMKAVHKENEYIKFVGRVRREEVQYYLSNVDILLHPVRNVPIDLYMKYGFSPQKYLDYYLSGKPIILTDTYAKIDEIQKQFVYQTSDQPDDVIALISRLSGQSHDPSIQLDYMQQNHIVNESYLGKLSYVFNDR